MAKKPKEKDKTAPVEGPSQFDLPAILTNYVQIGITDAGVRIAWGESPTGQPADMRFHMAHIIPLSVFPMVVELFNQMNVKIVEMQSQTSPMLRKDH